jgi:integrase
LTWDNVGLDPKPGWVQVTKRKTKFARRHVPLSARARGILLELKKDATTYVFSKDGAPVNRLSPSNDFHLREAMKLPSDCVIHSCRHTFCTRLGEAGASAFAIQRLAGTARPSSANATYTRLTHNWKGQ